MFGGCAECGRAAEKREASNTTQGWGKSATFNWRRAVWKSVRSKGRWSVLDRESDLPTHVEVTQPGHLGKSKFGGDGFQDKRKLIYLDNWINRTRWHHCCASEEISVMRSRIHRNVTVYSDGSCIIWKGRQEIGYQGSPGPFRTQKGERIINIVNLAFWVLVYIIKTELSIPFFFFSGNNKDLSSLFSFWICAPWLT